MSESPDTIPALLDRAIAAKGDSEAVVIVGAARITYRALAARVRGFASWLASRGVAKGDRVAIRAGNGIGFFDVYLGAARLGAAAVPIGVGLADPQVAHLLADSAPVLAVGDAQHADALRQAGIEVLILGSDEHLAATSAEETDLPPPDPDDIAIMMYTSGTTGSPKGVCLTHRALVANAGITAESQDFADEERYLTSTPLYHGSAGLRVYTLLGGAHTHVVLRDFEAGAWIDTVEREAITSTIAVPTQLVRILDDPSFEQGRLASLRLLVYGAAPSASSLVERLIEEMPCGLYQGYGLTEACAVVTGLTAEDHRRASADGRIGSCGRPIPGVEVKLVNESGSEVPVGEVGEILVRTSKLMAGYWNDPVATASALRDGWLHTGDLAWRDDEGYLFIVGRSKDLIISGGVNIHALEVETAIRHHPGVEDVAVVGAPDADWGEVVAAAVVPAAHWEPVAQEIVDSVESRLSNQARPRRVVFVSDLPRTSTGKVRRHEVLSLIDEAESS